MKRIKRNLSYLLLGQEGGKNRFQIIELLKERPYNINQIAENLDLNYRTVKHHIDVMVENDVITPSQEKGYGNVYFLSQKLENNIDIYEDIVQKFDNIITSPVLLKNLLENSNVAVIITDEDGKTIFYNRGAEEIFGYDEEEVLGKFLDIFEDQEFIKNIFDKVDEESKLIQEKKITTESGEKTYIELIVESVVDEEDEFLGYSVMAIDVSEREQIRQEKEEQYNVLNAIMEHTDSQLVYFDRDFNFVHVNQAYAESAGYTKEELIGKNHFEFFPDEENKEIFKKVRDTGKPISFSDKPFEFPNDPDRGTTYWDWTLAPVENDQGEIQGLVLSLIETTERVKYERQIEKANDRIKFLNTLIASIKDVNQLMIKEEDFDELIQEVPSILLDAQGFTNVTISMFNESDILIPEVNAGVHKKHYWELTRDGEGDAPGCVKKAVEDRDEIIVEQIEEFCNNCPLSHELPEHQTVVIPMIDEDFLLGTIRVCYHPETEIDEKTLELLREVSGDLVYAKKTKTAQKQLKKKEEQYRKLIENAPYFIERLNTDLEYTYVNPNMVDELGIEEEEFIGNTAGDIGMPDEVVEKWETALQKVIDTGEENEVEILYPHDDGKKRYLNKIIPEFDEDGSVESLLCFTKVVGE